MSSAEAREPLPSEKGTVHLNVIIHRAYGRDIGVSYTKAKVEF
jgi:hypothetical protein